MIQLSSLVWFMALFFGFLGYVRGWNREIIATAGVVLITFAIFQTDAFFRGTLFLSLPREQIFLIQAAVFLAVVVVVYRADDLSGGGDSRGRSRDRDRDRDEPVSWQAGVLGALIGAFNGYLIGGMLWYLLDINEYPIQQFVRAPTLDSVSAQNIGMIPLVMFGGGTSGSGDLLALAVIGVLFLAMVIAN